MEKERRHEIKRVIMLYIIVVASLIITSVGFTIQGSPQIFWQATRETGTAILLIGLTMLGIALYLTDIIDGRIEYYYYKKYGFSRTENTANIRKCAHVLGYRVYIFVVCKPIF